MNLSHAQPAIDEARPTRVRFRVVGFAVLLAMITYLDRACIATLAPEIQGDLSLTDDQMSYVFSAFAVAYAIFEIPTAAWADRRGTRIVLTRIVAWWSTFTMATAAATGLRSLVAIRFLFGLGEAGAWPSVARTFAQWIPQTERGTVQGIFFAGAHLAGGLTPFLVVALLGVLDWRAMFLVFGLFGFAWAACWHRWYRDDPAVHPKVNAAELNHILAGRSKERAHGGSREFWLRLARERNLWALGLMYLPNSFVFYFCITWLPRYLQEKHGFTDASLGVASGLPLLLSVAPDLLGGIATDWAVVRFGLRVGRASVGFLAYFTAGIAALAVTQADDPMAAAVLIAVATAASMFTLGAAWGTCVDIGGEHSGVVSAVMNTSGQIGSILSPLVVIQLVERFGDWNAPLYLIAMLFFIGAACWCFIDPRRGVFAGAADPATDF